MTSFILTYTDLGFCQVTSIAATASIKKIIPGNFKDNDSYLSCSVANPLESKFFGKLWITKKALIC